MTDWRLSACRQRKWHRKPIEITCCPLRIRNTAPTVPTNECNFFIRWRSFARFRVAIDAFYWRRVSDHWRDRCPRSLHTRPANWICMNSKFIAVHQSNANPCPIALHRWLVWCIYQVTEINSIQVFIDSVRILHAQTALYPFHSERSDKAKMKYPFVSPILRHEKAKHSEDFALIKAICWK